MSWLFGIIMFWLGIGLGIAIKTKKGTTIDAVPEEEPTEVIDTSDWDFDEVLSEEERDTLIWARQHDISVPEDPYALKRLLDSVSGVERCWQRGWLGTR